MTLLKIAHEEDSKRIKDVKRIADKFGIDTEVCKLEVGDYLWEDSGIVIEYKTAGDFVSSIADKRIFNECFAMKEQYEQCYLVFMNDFKNCFFNGKNKYITIDTIYGTIESIATRYKPLQLVPYETRIRSLEGIFSIYEKSEKGQIVESPVKVTQNKINYDNPDKYMLMCLPSIGEKTATKILETNGSFLNFIESVFNGTSKVRKDTYEFIEKVYGELHVSDN